MVLLGSLDGDTPALARQILYFSCHAVGPLEGETCTAVTLYSGQSVAQSE